MSQLEQGVKAFQSGIFDGMASLFETLATGQSPETLFITCSDSRIDPNLITQTKPGELFVIRNAGNVAPGHQAGDLSSAATIEYAVKALGVKRIIVCGHSDCGAMKGLQSLSDVKSSLPLVGAYLEQNYAGFEAETQSLDDLIANNVKKQLAELLTFDFLQEAVDAGRLSLDGWVYHIGSGKVMDVNSQQYL